MPAVYFTEYKCEIFACRCRESGKNMRISNFISKELIFLNTESENVEELIKKLIGIDKVLNSSIKQESMSFEGDVTDFFQKLSAEQEPLGREFEQVLFDNLWDLYQS